MRSGGRYVLGVDALPRGTFAAIAVGRTLATTLPLRSESGASLPLLARVQCAVTSAQTARGAGPAEVRLVCIDDTDDGEGLAEVEEWLDQSLAARLLVLDLVAPVIVGGDDCRWSVADSHDDALSLARACEAALW